jgi:parallel beta-helix repeat protein
MIIQLLSLSVLPFLTACGNSAEVKPNLIQNTLINSPTIGARALQSSTLKAGALFCMPQAPIQAPCTKASPCALETAVSKLQAGDTLYLRGGVYDLEHSITLPNSGTKAKPIMIASYPSERAILDGHENIQSIQKNIDVIRDGILLQGKKYITIRNLEIRNMGARGIHLLYSSYVTVEGCNIHDNHLSGISIYGGNYDAPYKPYKYGYNLIKDNIVYNNSDAGLNELHKVGAATFSYEDGDNADGIAVSSGKFNRVEHNTLFGNADDGIDFWRSNNSYAGYNIVYDNGRGKGGNGNGIKAGGNRYFDNEEDSPNGKLAIVEYNIAFGNKRIGFDINSGKKVTFRYNTSYHNGAQGFTSYDDTIVENNIASENAKKTTIRKQHKNNSWQHNKKVTFISTSPESEDFLRPTPNSDFTDIGAYASGDAVDKIAPLSQTRENAKLFLIGDSTLYNPTQEELGWGSALFDYMKHPKNLYNRARSGASSADYKKPNKKHRDWESTKSLILQSDLSQGAYLFIQFGHNNKEKDYDAFYRDIESYILEAKAVGVTPVLITPIERFYKHVDSQGKFPSVMRFLAKKHHITLLDLHQKSYDVFDSYPNHDAIFQTFGFDDHTHFNPKGAKIVAGWIRDLACQADNSLCTLFK